MAREKRDTMAQIQVYFNIGAGMEADGLDAPFRGENGPGRAGAASARDV